MRIAFLLLLTAGCASEADLVLELRRAIPAQQLYQAVCDAEHPESCDELIDVAHDGPTSELGIYLDSTIAPPLTVRLGSGSPRSCGDIEIDPALAPDLIVVQFPETDGADLVVEQCPQCRLVECPPPP
jgi:hypothetical protein